MAFMNIRKQEDVEQMLVNLQDEGHSLSLYLIHEVIAKQPEEIQELLLITAVLNRFCKSLIDAVQSHRRGIHQSSIPVKNLYTG